MTEGPWEVKRDEGWDKLATLCDFLGILLLLELFLLSVYLFIYVLLVVQWFTKHLDPEVCKVLI